MRRIFHAAPVVLALLILTACAPSDTEPAAEPEAAPPAAPAAATEAATEEELSAEEVVRRMSAHLASMDSFRLEARVEHDHVPTPGIKVEHEGDLTIDLARPARLYVSYRDDKVNKRVWINDGEVTLSDPDYAAYAKAPAEADVEKTLDRLYEEHGVVVPLDDLLAADPQAGLLANIQERKYLGIHQAGGVRCHHAIFDRGDMTWQVWVEAGDTPRLRKLVATYNDQEERPRYAVHIDSLEATTPNDATFTVDLAEDAVQAPFMEVTIEEETP